MTVEKTLNGRFLRAAVLLASLALGEAALPPLHAEVPSSTVGAYNEVTVSVIDTRLCDVGLRPPDNPGGWIETRLCDYDAGLATIDTVKLVGFKIYIK